MTLREVEFYELYAYQHARGIDDEVVREHPSLIKARKKVINLDFIVDIEELESGFVSANLSFGYRCETLYFRLSLHDVLRVLTP